MIGDDGPRHQVLFYEVTAAPALASTFGARGGIGSGTPGVAEPDKFRGITGVGAAKDGNLFVTLNEQGCVLRKFTPAGRFVRSDAAFKEPDRLQAPPLRFPLTGFGCFSQAGAQHTIRQCHPELRDSIKLHHVRGIGVDSSVSLGYYDLAPFAFNGKIGKIRIESLKK